MNRSRFDTILLGLEGSLLIVFAALFLLKAYSTLNWRMELDTPILLYASFLMDNYSLIPYRDIFETSMPGTFAFYYLIGKLFGYSDIAFRYVDLALLGVLLAATYLFMRRFGSLVAIWSAILFGLVYFAFGQACSLQRDFIGIIPIAFSLLVIPAKINSPVRLPHFIYIGFLFGLSVLIKPHLGIALPIVFVTLLWFRWHSEKKSISDFLVCATTSGVSLLIPIAIAIVWLAANSALSPLMDMVLHYLTLYNQMTGEFQTLPEPDHIAYLIQRTSHFGSYATIFLCSLFAFYHAMTNVKGDNTNVISLSCLFLCVLAYAIYPTLAGKFWPYHYFPFVYFCSISAGLCVFRVDQSASSLSGKLKQMLPILVLFITLTVQLPLYTYLTYLVRDVRSGADLHSPNKGRVDEIAGWLKNRLRPGDTVQPLDTTGGSIHAMLVAKAKLSTKFMGDYQFYHHISSPYIQGLRRVFISELHQTRPRFIIEVTTHDPSVSYKPSVGGIDTTSEFPELREFLNDNYSTAFYGMGYLIYERKIDLN